MELVCYVSYKKVRSMMEKIQKAMALGMAATLVPVAAGA